MNARALWNGYYWGRQELRSWDSLETFENIKQLLFEDLVRSIPGAGTDGTTLGQPMPQFVVRPSAARVRILIERPRPGDRNRYWDDPVNEIGKEDCVLQFMNYFDWDQQNYFDFLYYAVRIAKFPAHPELAGRDALLEVQYGEVFLGSI